MSGTRIQSEFVYNSGSAPKLYRFTIVSNSLGEILVRDIEDPYGAVLSPYTQIPKSVADDISAAMSQVENLLALTSAVNGTLTFVAESEKSVTFASPFSDTSYRVVLSPSVFAPFRITSKTTAGFTVSAGAAISGSVGYDVLV